MNPIDEAQLNYDLMTDPAYEEPDEEEINEAERDYDLEEYHAKEKEYFGS